MSRRLMFRTSAASPGRSPPTASTEEITAICVRDGLDPLKTSDRNIGGIT
ncbi:hypothetical protein IMZ48_40700 [Candidatus Bathyarchaeota archaeon]|nr:hypothetical protein [Candidatus Bathyarchaeota archaeon]